MVEYVHPSGSSDYRLVGEGLGFRYVASGPLVRSSYRAGEFFIRSAHRKAWRSANARVLYDEPAARNARIDRIQESAARPSKPSGTRESSAKTDFNFE